MRMCYTEVNEWYVCAHSIAVEQVLCQYLVSLKLSCDERMKRLCSLYAAVDDLSKKWVIIL